MISRPLQTPSTYTLCVGDLWPLADRVWMQQVSVCAKELLLKGFPISSSLPLLSLWPSPSLLWRCFPFLSLSSLPVLSLVWSFSFSAFLFLFSHSFLFILSSPPLSSLSYSPFLSSPNPSLLLPLPAPRNCKRARSPGIHQHWLRVFLVMGAEG